MLEAVLVGRVTMDFVVPLELGQYTLGRYGRFGGDRISGCFNGSCYPGIAIVQGGKATLRAVEPTVSI